MVALNITKPLPVVHSDYLKNCRVGLMEIYRFDCKMIEKQMPEIISGCNCGILKIASGSINGWGEYILPCEKRNADLVQWASVFNHLKGLSVSDALMFAESHAEAWGQDRTDLVKSALSDLAGKLYTRTLFNEPISDDEMLDRSYLIDLSQSYYAF